MTNHQGPSPLATCARVLHRRAEALVACAGEPGPGISVFLAKEPDQCHRLGLSSVPATYLRTHARIVALGRALSKIEAGGDCIAPRVLARRIAPVLSRSPYRGFRIRLRSPGEGRCGTLGIDAFGRLDLTGALDTHERELLIFATIPRSLRLLLENLNRRLLQTTGRRCFSPGGLEDYVRRALPGVALEPRFAVTRTPPHVSFIGGRKARYGNGCAVAVVASIATPGTVSAAWREGRSRVNVWIAQRAASQAVGDNGAPGLGAYH